MTKKVSINEDEIMELRKEVKHLQHKVEHMTRGYQVHLAWNVDETACKLPLDEVESTLEVEECTCRNCLKAYEKDMQKYNREWEKDKKEKEKAKK